MESGPASSSCDGDASDHAARVLADVVSAILRRSLQSAVRRIGQLNRMTESGALSTGRSLESIVSQAQAYTLRARSTLEGIAGSDDQRGIAQLISVQNEILDNFVQQIRVQIDRQAEVARAALQSSSQIANLGNQIGAVAFQSRLLSLNASIEAGRLGDQGRAFGVIAAEMTKLSQQIESTSKAVNELVSSLSATLPSVSEATKEMQASSEVLIDDIGGSMSQLDQKVKDLALSVQHTLHAGDKCIAEIIRHSQDALSSLQFQDPVAQGLVAVAKDFNHAARTVHETVVSSSLAARPMHALPQSRVIDRAGRSEEIEHVAVVANIPQASPAGEVVLF
jgi:methyl-accepting chemotaxis protein